MAVPTYEELLSHNGVENSIMKQMFDDEHLRKFSLRLDMWERLAKFLGMPNSDIVDIKSQGDAAGQRLGMLECWKQRRGSKATYEAMVKALLQISRTDLAEKVINLRQSSIEIHALGTTTTNQTLPCRNEPSLTAPTSPASSSGIEGAVSPSAMSPLSLPATPSEHTAQEVISTLRELEEEFYDLVIYVKDALEKSQACLNTIIRWFRMLPQSVKRQHQTDENYKETRRRILKSKTVKKLFDNLTELKHWNYMTPDTLAHILKDVKIDDVHKKIDEYKDKLMAFKANTKLRELIGTSFPVPDYCMELTMEVEGWEDKTIREVEERAVNIVRQAAYSGGSHISLGWKGVIPGSIKVTFILMESVKLIPEKLFEDDGVVSIQVDGDIFHSKDYTKVNTCTTVGNTAAVDRDRKQHTNALLLQASAIIALVVIALGVIQCAQNIVVTIVIGIATIPILLAVFEANAGHGRILDIMMDHFDFLARLLGQTLGNFIPFLCPHCGKWSRISSYGPGTVVRGLINCPNCHRDIFGRAP